MYDPFANASSPSCDECPAALLEEALATPPGRMISQAIELDFALQAGLTVSLSEVTYREFLLLRVLSEERNRYQAEAQERATGNGR